jgi:hypothetical protein
MHYKYIHCGKCIIRTHPSEGTYRRVVEGNFGLGTVICIIRTHPKPPSMFFIPIFTSLRVICIIRTRPKPPSMFFIPIITSLRVTKVTTPTTSLFYPFWKNFRPTLYGVLPLHRFVLRIGRHHHTYNTFQEKIYCEKNLLHLHMQRFKPNPSHIICNITRLRDELGFHLLQLSPEILK